MNNLETEFKFRIDNLPTKNFEKAKKYHFEQIYFEGEKKEELLKKVFPLVDFRTINTHRIRYIDDSSNKKIILTIKSKALANGMSRVEEEKEIDSDFASELIKGVNTDTIIKDRYVDSYNGYNFEFDEYLNLDIKLFTVEVEVSADVIYKVEIGRFTDMIESHYGVKCSDVTFDPRYKNSNLNKFFRK